MAIQKGATEITDKTVTSIAEEIGRDARSIVRVLAGLPVRGRAGADIRRALEARGLVQANNNPQSAA